MCVRVLEALMSGQIQNVRTPTGVLPLVRQTAEKLLAEGVISGTIDGDLHAADAATVKAAILSSAICDFCSVPGATHFFDVPDFGITQNDNPYNYGAAKSTGGWMACDTCNEIIRTNKRAALIDRAVATMAFPKFTRRAVEELYAKFWQGMDERAYATGTAAAVADFVEDRSPAFKPVLTEREQRVKAMIRVMGLTSDEVEGVVQGKLSRDVVSKLTRWHRDNGRPTDSRALADLLADNGPKKPLADIVPHWQRALDAKFQALSGLAEAMKIARAPNPKNPVEVALAARVSKNNKLLRGMGFEEDVKFLKAAQAYSFNAETAATIREAARGIPRNAPLSSIETPNTGAGWFWFAEPLPITASPLASDRTHALLWGWTPGEIRYRLTIDEDLIQRIDPDTLAQLKQSCDTSDDGCVDLELIKRVFLSARVSQAEYDACVEPIESSPSITFSAYVVDEKGMMAGGKATRNVYPSTRWHWPLDQSFSDMLAFNARNHDKTYGPGGPHHGDADLIGKEATLQCIEELSLFFVMACLWFKQTVPILTRAPGHVERHARKRLQREHKLDEKPTVQVVALRRSARVDASSVTEHREGGREYHCRWVVQGHPRLQRCGPALKDQKLIWIESHPAGPADKPLRTKTKVFAVIR